MSVKVTVRNKDKLFAKLKRLVPEADAALTKVNGEAAREMAALAKAYVPVRTGRLRDSIAVTPPGGVPPGHSQGARVVPPGSFMVTAGDTGVRYPHLVEFGAKAHAAGGRFEGAEHPGAPPQPYFWPAYRLVRRRHRARAGRALGASIKKVAAK